MMLSKFISVRVIMGYTPKDAFNGLQGTYNIKFDDGSTATMTSKELIVSRYFWEIFTLFPDFQITSKYNIVNYYKNGLYSTNTHNDFFNVVLKDLCLGYLIPSGKMSLEAMDVIYRTMFIIINDIFNEVVYNVLEYMSTINIINLLDIQMDKELLEAIDNVRVENSIESTKKAYDVLNEVMYKPIHKDNPVSKAYISGIINANQVKQVLGPRGFTTELNGTIFKYPIYNSYTLGLQNLYDLATESRSAAKSLHLSTEGIRQSEWFARELQLLLMPLKKISWEDCGNTDYILWYVRDKELDDNGNVIYAGDLKNLYGKLYYDEDNECEEYIDEHKTNLIGKNILIRSAMKCKHPDKHSICYKCFGALSYTIPAHANLGNYSGTFMSSKISQGMLSSKHLTSSATGGSVALDDISEQFFLVKNGNKYCLKPQFLNVKKNLKLVIDQQQCFGLKDIKCVDDVKRIDPSRTTKVEYFTLIVDDKEKYTINVKSGANYAIFEPKFLAFIISNGYEYDNKDKFTIDLSRWVSPTSLFYIPEREYSFFNFGKEVKTLIMTRNALQGNISKDTQESLLFKLFNLVNSKLSINLAILENIVYCLTVQNYPEMNLDMGRNSPNPQLADLKSIISYRSMSAGYAHSELVSKLYDPLSFSNNNRPDHILDILIKPNEVVKENYPYMFE